MAKSKSFDPDALAKAGQEIAKKHQVREKPETPAPPPKKRGPKSDERTQLCRIGISFHRRVKLEAVKKDMTIRQFLEELIAENVPEV